MQNIIIAASLIISLVSLFLTIKNHLKMAQQEELAAILAESQATNAELAGILTTVIADIKAAQAAQTPVSEDTITALQATADGLKANVDAVNAALPVAAPAQS